MEIPSKMQIRRWLVEKSRAQILAELAQLKSEHGDEHEQDVRDMLNNERKRKYIDSPAEASLLRQQEQLKAQLTEQMDAQVQPFKQLYGDDKA